MNEPIASVSGEIVFVTPLPGMDRPTGLQSATKVVADSLEQVASRLAELRAQRAEINEEIKRLVGEEELLQRMARAARAEPRKADK